MVIGLVMKKGFLSEVRRLEKAKHLEIDFFEDAIQQSYKIWASKNGYDLYNYGDSEPQSEDDYLRALNQRGERLRATVAGSLVLKLDNPNAKFPNEHLWYLYFDPSAINTKKGESSEDDLLSCLGCLEFDGVFRYETQELPKEHFFKKLPISKYIVPGMSISDYCQIIVMECYMKGKFETPLWQIENNGISSRRK